MWLMNSRSSARDEIEQNSLEVRTKDISKDLFVTLKYMVSVARTGSAVRSDVT